MVFSIFRCSITKIKRICCYCCCYFQCPCYFIFLVGDCFFFALLFASVFKIHFRFMVKTTHSFYNSVYWLGIFFFFFIIIIIYSLDSFLHWFVSAAFYKCVIYFFLYQETKLCMHILIRVSPYKYIHMLCLVLCCVYVGPLFCCSIQF